MLDYTASYNLLYTTCFHSLMLFIFFFFFSFIFHIFGFSLYCCFFQMWMVTTLTGLRANQSPTHALSLINVGKKVDLQGRRTCIGSNQIPRLRTSLNSISFFKDWSLRERWMRRSSCERQLFPCCSFLLVNA